MTDEKNEKTSCPYPCRLHGEIALKTRLACDGITRLENVMRKEQDRQWATIGEKADKAQVRWLIGIIVACIVGLMGFQGLVLDKVSDAKAAAVNASNEANETQIRIEERAKIEKQLLEMKINKVNGDR